MRNFIKKYERYVFIILSVILMLYITVEIVELIYQFFSSIFKMDEGNGRLIVSTSLLKDFLPIFFNILIAIELIDTFLIYMQKHSIKVLNILLIGLIAIGRKLIAFDFNDLSGLSNIGLAALIIALAGGYYLIKKDEYKERECEDKFKD
ncbi:MAG: phosphate-starvation-inducible PsiE family protein [Bacteroidales bacterium]|jgi:uncharacterized membrane protein (DUF373 family)|nr:phosphate-starvation-inducible PsiE family protein [Bacteroidales bacterium]MDD3272853.1 phosphate-starvation-inducible PsiE family protein [Bacteroidales bacterium]MDD4058455.1 phosphate-starvation-inducible PsiE family protein [Bacteroidales bacterium]